MTDACRKFLPQIHDWLEGCADEEVSLLAQLHLQDCPHCRRIVEEWETVAKEIGSSLSMAAPDGFEEKLRFKLPKTQLTSWHELSVSWSLTVGIVSIATLWFSVSLTEVLSLLQQWVLGTISWSSLPVQWLRWVLDLARHWV